MKVTRKITALVSALALGAGLSLIATPASAQMSNNGTPPVTPYNPWSMSGIAPYGDIGNCPNNNLCLYSGERLGGSKLSTTDSIYTSAVSAVLRTYYGYTGVYFSAARLKPALSAANAGLISMCTYNLSGVLTNTIPPRSALNLPKNQDRDASYVTMGYPTCASSVSSMLMLY